MKSTASMAGNPLNPAVRPHTLPRHPSHWISQCTKEGWSHWRIQWKNKGREEGVVKYSANANQLTLPRYSKCHANISVALSQRCAKHVTWLRTADHLPFCTAFLVNLVKLHLTASCSFSQSQCTMVHTIKVILYSLTICREISGYDLYTGHIHEKISIKKLLSWYRLWSCHKFASSLHTNL